MTEAVASEKHDIVETRIEKYTSELRRLLLDGWEIDPACPGEVIGPYGASYTVSMFRDASTVAKFQGKCANVAPKAKLSQAEHLANARAAKAAKAKG